MLMVVRPVVRKKCSFKRGAQSAVDELYINTLIEYIISWSKSMDGIRDNKEIGDSGVKKNKFEEAVRTFAKYVQSGYGGDSKELVIRMVDNWTLADEDRIVDELTDACVCLFIKRSMPLASTGKWLKTGAANDVFLMGIQNRLIGDVIDEGLAELSFDVRAVAEEEQRELDDSFLEFSRVCGKNKERCKQKKTTKHGVHILKAKKLT